MVDREWVGLVGHVRCVGVVTGANRSTARLENVFSDDGLTRSGPTIGISSRRSWSWDRIEVTMISAPVTIEYEVRTTVSVGLFHAGNRDFPCHYDSTFIIVAM
jgi:hypothetical protein